MNDYGYLDVYRRPCDVNLSPPIPAIGFERALHESQEKLAAVEEQLLDLLKFVRGQKERQWPTESKVFSGKSYD